MCGIAGILDLRGTRQVSEGLLENMTRSQAHRGPDGEGYFFDPGVGLGHRRLAIIDLGGGKQPLFNEDGTVAVTYNGEIYNFGSLKAELEQRGHLFRTHCDTEVIVHAWEEWGEECVHRFRGMFVFAIWDRNRETLFLARDRLGIKPLYYAISSDGFLYFASELKALRLCPNLDWSFDIRAVEEYFAFGYVPDPKCIYQQVRKLAPGYVIKVTRGVESVHPRRYWDVPFAPVSYADQSEVEDQIVERLTAAVRMRLIADVPLGAFLSGGVDSSAVVALMTEIGGGAVNTCAISFGDPAYNESEFARMVAEKFGTQHHCEQVDAQDFSLVDRLASVYDEPFADSSAIPTYRVCELARRHVTVALSGDGGDENFIGYRRYRWFAFEERFRRRVPGWLREPLFGLAGSIYPKADWAPRFLRAKATLQAIARDSADGYLHGVSIMNSETRNRLFSDRFRKELQGYRAIEVFQEHLQNAPTDDPLGRIQYLDYKTYLPGDILTKVDRASMANSLEVRVPILDHEFVGWVSGLPSDLKLRGGEGKFIFKKALERYLPRDILYRPKMGFAVPLAAWFRGPLRATVRETVVKDLCDRSDWFDRKTLQVIVGEHQSGVRDHSASIWALLMFAKFLQQAEV